MIRQATEDMVLTTDDPHLATNGGRLPVAKGTTLVVDMVGMRKFLLHLVYFNRLRRANSVHRL